MTHHNDETSVATDGTASLTLHDAPPTPTPPGAVAEGAAYADFPPTAGTGETQTLLLHEEQILVDKRTIETGVVSVVREIETRVEDLEVPVVRTNVRIERVAVNRMVDERPEPRHEPGLTIIPVVEEIVEVRRRYRIVEEVRLSTVETTDVVRESVSLTRETISVDRREPEGDPERS